MAHNYVFIGGVDVSEACLGALCRLGLPPALAVGYDASRASASGYRDLSPLAAQHGFALEQAAQVNDPILVERIKRLDPALIFVIGWSQILRPELLGIPRNGCVGIHPTDLPEGRGRAPIPWTILKGLRRTASTMFFLAEGVDDGDIVGKVHIDVDARETAATLYAKHRDAHVSLVTSFGEALLSGIAPRTPQDHAKATYWEGRSPADGQLDPRNTVEAADRLVRAVTHPFPGAFVMRPDGRRLTIWSAEPAPSLGLPAGELVEIAGVLMLECADGALRLTDTESAAT